MTLQDADLVERARGGDREALGLLWERSAPKVRRWVSRKVAACDVDDVTQDVAVGLIESLPRIVGGLTHWQFLSLLVKVCAREHRRHRGPAPVDAPPEACPAARDDRSPERVAEARQSLTATLRALASMKPWFREAFVRYRVDGETTADVAAATGVSVAAVASRVCRAGKVVSLALTGDADGIRFGRGEPLASRQRNDLTGRTFGLLAVEGPSSYDRRQRSLRYWARCGGCGDRKEYRAKELVRGSTRTCGARGCKGRARQEAA